MDFIMDLMVDLSDSDKFEDEEFPPCAASIGELNGMSYEEVREMIEWKRLYDMFEDCGSDGVQLFEGEVSPEDVAQGRLGNCWMLSALATLANLEGRIQDIFITKECSEYGKYEVRLYDGITKEWVDVAIDSWIPCSRETGSPIFAQPNANEAWVLLLEKAFAKFKGSYAALSGGFPLWALQALTGGTGFSYRYVDDCWRRILMQHPESRSERPDFFYACNEDGEIEEGLEDDAMCKLMFKFKKSGALVNAGSSGADDSQESGGIVQGHAYTILRLERMEGGDGEVFRLIQLRNPWGSFEWQGAWSDHSEKWEEYPDIAEALEHTPENDGTFWMEFEDFKSMFRMLDFVLPEAPELEEVNFDPEEETSCCIQ